MLRWDVEEGTNTAATCSCGEEVKGVGVVQKCADRSVGIREYKLLCAALCCLRRKGVHDTAVSRGKARSEVSFAEHMYSKIAPTVVSNCWRYGCDGA
jgi:hypothetical protein